MFHGFYYFIFRIYIPNISIIKDLERVQQKATKMMKRLEHFSYEERRREWERWNCSAWRRESSGWISPGCINTQRKGGKNSNVLFRSVQWQDQSKWVRSETQEVLSEHQETHLHCKGDQALAEAAQGHCGLPTLKDIQKQSGHGPGKLVLSHPAWAGGLDQVASRGSFPLQPVCESVIP